MKTPALLATLFLTTSALAQPFVQLPVQGTLTDSAGLAINGTLPVTFTLYDDASRTTTVWSNSVDVTFTEGSFTAYLGAASNLDSQYFADYPTLHLGIAVDTDPEMTPFALGHSAYAAWAERANDAELLNGFTSTELLDQAFLNNPFNNEADLTAVLDDNYATAGAGDFQNLTNVPPDLLDGDDIRSQAEVEAWAQGVCYDTEAELTAVLDDNYLPSTYTPAWNDLTGVPAGFADGSDDARTQAEVEGWARAVAYDSEAELTADLNDNYLPISYTPTWSSLSGVPGGFADGIDNQVSQSQVETWARGVAYNTEAELTADLDDNYLPATYTPAFGDLTGVPSGLADGDNDTTYSAGTGLSASGTTFNLDPGEVGHVQNSAGTPLRTCIGSSPTNGTGWTPYSTTGIVITVDTSGCGFTSTPTYYTSLHGNGSHWQLVGSNAVYNPSSTSFRIYMTYRSGSAPTPAQADSSNWHIRYIAVGQ